MDGSADGTLRSDEIRIGAVFPQTEIGLNPADIVRFASDVESLGYKHLLAFDHVIGGSPSAHAQLANRANVNTMFHEVIVLFSYLAAVTNDIEFASGVIILPQRQTTLVAKQFAELDVLSGGRTRVGVGIGWNKVEFEALNEDFSNRARRLEEQINLLRHLWSEDVVDFHGAYHDVTHAGILPMPIQRPIPLWVGGEAEPAVRRAARLGDGFMATTPIGSELDHVLDWLWDELDQAGRSRDTFGLEGRISLAQGGEDDWRRAFAFWQSAGATHISLETLGGVYADVADHTNALERGIRVIESM